MNNKSTSNHPRPTTPHGQALAAKHRGLENQLRDELSRPAPDTREVAVLKKEKLKIAESIEAEAAAQAA